MVALQNRENNEVPCKIVQGKKLCVLSAFVGSLRLEGGDVPGRWLEGILPRSLCDEGWKSSASTCGAASGLLRLRKKG
jgi:hypothetical protein